MLPCQCLVEFTAVLVQPQSAGLFLNCCHLMVGKLSEESFFCFLLLVSSPLLSAVSLSQSKASMWISLDVLDIITILSSCTSSLFQGKSQLSSVVKSMHILRYFPETSPCLSLESASFAYSFSFKSYLFGSPRCPKDKLNDDKMTCFYHKGSAALSRYF